MHVYGIVGRHLRTSGAVSYAHPCIRVRSRFGIIYDINEIICDAIKNRARTERSDINS